MRDSSYLHEHVGLRAMISSSIVAVVPRRWTRTARLLEIAKVEFSDCHNLVEMLTSASEVTQQDSCSSSQSSSTVNEISTRNGGSRGPCGKLLGCTQLQLLLRSETDHRIII